MYWSGYDAPTALGLLEANGFVVDRAKVETVDENGKAGSFLWLAARRQQERRVSVLRRQSSAYR
jgi:hypothetical protein